MLSHSEAELLHDYDRKVMEIINVDDFSSEELAAGMATDRGDHALRNIA